MASTPDATRAALLYSLRECAARLGKSLDPDAPDAIRRDEWKANALRPGPGDKSRLRHFATWRAFLEAASREEGPLEIECDLSDLHDEPPLPAIPHRHLVKGVSTYVDRNGNVLGQWIKTRTEQETREEVLRNLLETLPASIANVRAVEPPPKALPQDILAVYPMGDPHLGMLAWGEETGADFDLEKAEALMRGAIDELTQNEPEAHTALLVNLGDFFHSDNQTNRTARSGHQLDVDTRWAKVLRVGVHVMAYMVDRALTRHHSVHVINEIGNHDDHSSIMLSVALSERYRNEPRVRVDMSPARRHYFRFGRCLVGVSHGDQIKLPELESLMAAERPADWGQTQHRYWYTGHVHHRQAKEYRGCVVESFRTLAARDAYAAGAGYNAGRDMNRIALHAEHGEIARSTVNAAYLLDRMAQ